MKYSEMNDRQKKASRNIMYAARDLIGGLENTMSDCSEDSEDYQNAKSLLENHEALVSEVYDCAISAVYEEGSCWFSKAAESYLKDIRFCGKEWLMERCDKRVTKEGY